MALISRLAVLRQRNFRLVFIGQTVSIIGTWMVPVALSFAVLREGGGAREVGYVLAAQTAPLLVFVLIGGVVADWLTPRPVMLAADVVRCCSEATMAGLLFSGRLPLWLMMALAGVLGLGQAFSGPPKNALIAQIVAPRWRQDANALSGLSFSSGIVLGPGIAGGLVAAFGPAPAFAIDAASFAVSALCLSRLRISGRPPASSESFVQRMVAGWHEFRSHTWLWVLVLQWTFYGPLVMAPFMALGPVVSDQSYGGAGAWGLILAIYGLGAVGGDVIALSFRPKRPMLVATIATMAYSLPVTALALRWPVLVVAATACLTGAGLAVFIALWSTTLQHEVAPEALARVSAYDWFGSNLLIPAGYAMIGPLSAAIGVPGVLILAAVWQFVSSIAVLAVPGVRMVSTAMLRESTP